MAHRERPLDKGLSIMNDSSLFYGVFRSIGIIDSTRLGSRIGKHGNDITANTYKRILRKSLWMGTGHFELEFRNSGIRARH